jgi:hypothetical protein
MLPPMAGWLVKRRLTRVGRRLSSLRGELRVLDEQLVHLTDDADDTRIRSLVSENQLAEREHRDAQRHADAQSAHRARLVATIAELERRQDELLDQLGS